MKFLDRNDNNFTKSPNKKLESQNVVWLKSRRLWEAHFTTAKQTHQQMVRNELNSRRYKILKNMRLQILQTN